MDKSGVISQKYTIYLDNARTSGAPELLTSQGNVCFISNSSSANANINLQFSNEGAAQIGPLGFKLNTFFAINSIFDRIFMTNDAQPGDWVEITVMLQNPAPTNTIYQPQGQTSVSGAISIAPNQYMGVDGGSGMNTGQVGVTSSGSLIAAANPTRKSITLYNSDAAARVFIGNNGVGTSTGHWIPPNSTISLNNRAAIYGKTTGSTATVTYLEEVA